MQTSGIKIPTGVSIVGQLGISLSAVHFAKPEFTDEYCSGNTLQRDSLQCATHHFLNQQILDSKLHTSCTVGPELHTLSSRLFVDFCSHFNLPTLTCIIIVFFLQVNLTENFTRSTSRDFRILNSKLDDILNEEDDDDIDKDDEKMDDEDEEEEEVSNSVQPSNTAAASSSAAAAATSVPPAAKRLKR